MYAFVDSIQNFGELDETTTEDYEELHKVIIKEPLLLASNAQQMEAIFCNYRRIQMARPLHLENFFKKQQAIKPPLLKPVCSKPPRKPSEQQVSLIKQLSLLANINLDEDSIPFLFVHNSAKLKGYQNKELTPFFKVRASSSYYNQSQFNFVQFTDGNQSAYARLDLLFSIHSCGYCVCTNLQREPLPLGAQSLEANLFSMTDQMIIPIDRILSIQHFLPDASLNKKGNLILSNKWWHNPTATLF